MGVSQNVHTQIQFILNAARGTHDGACELFARFRPSREMLDVLRPVMVWIAGAMV